MLSDRRILEHCGLSQISGEFCVSNSFTFESILNEILSNFHPPESPDTLPPLFLLAALHHIPGTWQSPNTLALSNELLQHFYEHRNVDNLTDFMVLTQAGDALIFALFRPIQLLFTGNDWSSSPTAKLLALWLQDQLTYPTLGSYLHLFFPILLKLLDDFIPDNKVLALKSCLHMTERVAQADLLIHNRAEVLLSALDGFLYTDYTDVLSNLQPLVSKLLSIVEQPPYKGVSPHMLGLTKHDKYLEKLLQTLMSSSFIEIKRTRIKILLQCILSFGASLYPHLHQIVIIAERYLEIPDKSREETRFLTLDVLLLICQYCSPRIKFYLFRIVLALIKVLTQCSQSKLDTKPKSQLYQQLSHKVVECYERLNECDGCSDQLLQYLKAVEQVKGGSSYVRITLNDVIRRISIEKSD